MLPRLIGLTAAALGLALGTVQPALAESVLDRISRTGRLNTVVMDGDLPYSVQQGSSYAGLGLEFVQEIQAELSEYAGKPLQLVPQPVGSVEQGIAAIASGNVDLACGVSFSWGRSMFVDYSLPIALSGTRLITPSSNDGTPKSLAGKTIGVVTNSVAASTIGKAVPTAQLKTYDSPATALSALKSGQIQFLAGDSLWLLANKASVDPSGQIAPAVPYNRSGVGCIVPENNSGLLNLSNLAIARLMQAYINDDPQALQRINRWVGPGSSVNLNQDAIKAYFTNVLLSAALIDLP